MSDFYNDSRQEYEGLGESTTITEIINVDNTDLLTPPETSDANFLIRLVNANNVSQLYILQANTLGEIRFLTLDAKNNNNQGGELLYNTKIGADGKLYFYHSYNATINLFKVSGWYEVGLNIAQVETNILGVDFKVDTTIGGLATLTAEVLAMASTLAELEIDTSAIAVNHEARIQFLEYASGWDVETIRTTANIRDQGNTISQSLFEIIYANGFTPDIVTSVSRARLTSQLSSVLYFVLNNGLGALALLGVGAGIYAAVNQAMDEKKKDIYRNELIALNDTLQETPVSTSEDYLIHTGLSIISGNSGFTTSGTYRITVQREAVIIIFINSSLIASVVNVEQFGTSTFNIGESILIAKSLLGGGTGDELELEVIQLATFKEWTEARSSYIITKLNGIDTKQRRKEGVIGADDIDTSQFTTTNQTYTDTTDDVFNETITYKQLKSRLNLLPSGTSDVDVYTSTGKIGIGTTPAPYTPLHIYHTTDSVARIQSGTSGTSSIQFIRGVEADSLIDYRFVNDTNLFRLQFQDGATATQFGDGNSYLIDVSLTNTRFYKDLQVSGNVGINTAPHATYDLDVNGTSRFVAGTRFVGNVGMGTTPHATYDLDVYGTTRLLDFVGIGTAPTDDNLGLFFEPQLRIGNNGSARDTLIYLEASSSYLSGIEFGKGDRDDILPDFRIVNRAEGLSFEFQDDLIKYGDVASEENGNIASEIMLLKPSGSYISTSTTITGNVGIGTPAELYSTNLLVVKGDTKITNGSLHITDGSVGIGTTEPNTKLHIQSTTNDTRLTIEDMDTTANGLPADIVFPDGDYASTVVVGSSTDKWVYINNSIISSNKTTRFTVLQRMEVDLLLVGGGGAGGHNVGGGGGGGGIFYGKNIILEAGNYKIVVGRGGIGQIGQTTVRLASANGEPTYLCYDGKYETPVKFNLGGTMREAIGLGGGSGATAVAGNFNSYRGHNGGSGGGSSEGAANAYLANNGGTALQPATFWNGTAYEVGGTNGRANTDTAIDFRGGGGGGGTASAPAMTNSYTCGKRTVQITFANGISYSLSGGGGSVAFATTDLTATEGLGGANPSGGVFGGFGAFYNSGNATLSPASNGVDNSGSGGGGSGINTAGGLWTKAGNGGTGIAMIRYRLAERKNSSSLDLFRNNSTLTGYSVGNYEGQFKIQKQNQTTPAILVNPIQNVSIGSRYAPQIFSVGNKGGRLRIANDSADYTEIGVNDDSSPPCIRMMGNGRTDGKQGSIEYEIAGTGKHTFTGEGVFTGYVKSKSDALYAVANHALYNFPANNLLTSLPTQGWETRLVNTSSWDGGGFYPQTAGIYFVSATCYMTNSNHSFSIRLNATSATTGTEYAVGNGPAGFSATATAIIRLLTTDNITLWAGANGCGITNNPRSSLSIYLLMGE